MTSGDFAHFVDYTRTITTFLPELVIYGTSMMISLPVAEQFHYNVFVLAAGMLVLAGLTRIPLTLDAVLGRRRLAAEQAQVSPHQPVIRTRHAEREARVIDQAVERAD